MQLTKEHIFTHEELQAWIDNVGGIGTEIKMPRVTYYIEGIGNPRIWQYNCPYEKMIIKQINYNYSPSPHVLFEHSKSGFDIPLLFNGMRNIKPLPLLYKNKCKKCRMPARKCDGYVFCSNKKCKINKKVINTITYGTQNNPIKALCPQCKKLCALGKNVLLCPTHGEVDYNFNFCKWYYDKYGQTMKRLQQGMLLHSYNPYWGFSLC